MPRTAKLPRLQAFVVPPGPVNAPMRNAPMRKAQMPNASKWPTRTSPIALWLAATTLLGCFSSSSNPDDASVSRDGSMCSVGGTVVALTCPSSPSGPEDLARASFQVRGACCTTSTDSTVVRASDRLILSRTTSYCDCPSGGPTPSCGTDVQVELPRLEPGVYTVQLEGYECTFEVADECRSTSIDELRAPRAVFEGDDFAFSALAHDPGTCSCAPTLATDGTTFSPRLCGCCDECDCVDRGYELGHVGPATSGPYTVDGITRELGVHSLDSCSPATPTDLRLIPPEADYRSTGPRIFWAVVSASPQVCCSEPFGAIRALEVGAIATTLELRTCHQDPCPCIGPETPFEAWYPLGELGPGTHHFRAGIHEREITVGADGRVVE